MGDTGEIPLSFKGFRLMLNYCHRIHRLPNETLVKIALIENVNIRTTWIRTIEKLQNLFEITYAENIVRFKTAIKKVSRIKVFENMGTQTFPHRSIKIGILQNSQKHIWIRSLLR